MEILIKQKKDSDDGIPGNNVANIFKAKKHSEKFYKEIMEKFKDFVPK